MIQIKALANTDTNTWPDEFVKVYLNKYLADQENEDGNGELDSKTLVFKDYLYCKIIFCHKVACDVYVMIFLFSGKILFRF